MKHVVYLWHGALCGLASAEIGHLAGLGWQLAFVPVVIAMGIMLGAVTSRSPR